MHDLPVTIRTLPYMIMMLENIGYQFVTVEEMLPPPEPPPAITYTVRSGDTLEEIAARYAVTVEDILQVNGPFHRFFV